MVGCHISDDLKQMALSMSLQGLRDSDIHEYMGISVRSLKRLRSTFRETGGDVSRKPISTGRPRILTSING
jgi:transposase